MMRAYSLKEIYEALEYGDKNNYQLFPEMFCCEAVERVKENKITAALAEKIISKADMITTKDISPLLFSEMLLYEKEGNRATFENHYRENFSDIAILAIAGYISDNERYTEKLQDCLWQWMNEYTWEFPAHFALRPNDVCFLRKEGNVASGLFSCSAAFAVAEINKMYGERFHPMLKKRIADEIDKRIFIPYKNGLQFWEGGGHNWAAVCSSSIGGAALYSDIPFEDLTIIICRVIAANVSFFETLCDDGLSTEGLGYWSYAFSYFTFFACLLYERTCGKIDLFDDDFVRLTASFPAVMQFPDGHCVNFADTPSNRYDGNLGFLTKLSELMGQSYRIPEVQEITGGFTGMSRNLFWGVNSTRVGKAKVKTGEFWYECAQVIVARDYDKNGIFNAFVAKAGYNKEAHNHNDVGSFILNLENFPIFIDLGAPPYKKSTFEDETRYKILNCSSKSHNVPEIDGNTQSHGSEYAARNVMYEKGTFSLDIAGAYEKGVCERLYRTFEWDTENMVYCIHDEIKFSDNGHNIKERFVTEVRPEIKKGKAVIRKNKYFAQISAEACEPHVVETEYETHVGNKAKCYFIEFDFYTSDNEKKIEINIECGESI